MKRTITKVCLLALALLALAACKKKTDAARVSGEPGLKTLVVGELWNIEGMDLAAHDATLVVEKMLVAEPLVAIDNNFNIIPGLAESWKNIDNLTWEFRLKPGIKFHDGTALDGAAVKFWLNRMLEVAPTVVSFTKIDQINVIDTLVVQIKTKTPNADLPESLHYSKTAILSRSSVDGSGKFIKPVGTGPFIYQSYDPGSGNVVVVRNENYYGTKAHIDKVVFRPITDPNTRAMAIENGEIDFTIDPPLNEIDHLKTLKGLIVNSYETPRVYIAKMNVKHAPLNDLKVRQALAYAIDNDAIAEHILYGVGSPASGPYSANIAWNDNNIKPYDYDPTLAKKILSEAGYADSNGDGLLDKDGKDIVLRLITYPERPGLPPIAQALQGFFADIGVRLVVDIMTSSASTDALKSLDWDFYLMANATTQIPTPYYHLNDAYSTESNASTGGYSNKEVDNLLAELSDTFEQKKKYEIARQIQQVIHDDVAAYWIAYYGVAIVMKNTVKNFVFNPTAHDYMLNPDMTIE